MIHFKPSAFFRSRIHAQAVSPSPVLPSDGIAQSYTRADHARMLSHAATRRRAAQDASRIDGDYWKACAPAALAKAVAIRSEAGFARLP